MMVESNNIVGKSFENQDTIVSTSEKFRNCHFEGGVIRYPWGCELQDFISKHFESCRFYFVEFKPYH